MVEDGGGVERVGGREATPHAARGRRCPRTAPPNAVAMQFMQHELHHRDKATLCNPWQQLPAQFFSANQSSICWQNGSTSMLACPGGSGACFSSTHPMLREQLKTWWAAGGALSVREAQRHEEHTALTTL